VAALVPLRTRSTIVPLEVTFKEGIRDVFNIDSAARVEPSLVTAALPAQDIWLTDPPYADAIYYHELSEFFLAWSLVSQRLIEQSQLVTLKGIG
jgi:adenine-specific DNA methylase